MYLSKNPVFDIDVIKIVPYYSDSVAQPGNRGPGKRGILDTSFY